jgi:signal transduction histidine kinase
MSDVADQTLKSIASAARHDMKQSLHVVSLYLQLAQRQLPSDHPVYEALGRASDALGTQRDLIARLREVAEVPRPSKGRADLRAAVERIDAGRGALTLPGDDECWVAVPTARLDRLVGHLVGAAGAHHGGRLAMDCGDEQVQLSVFGPQPPPEGEPTWTDDEESAERWLVRRLVDVVRGASLTVRAEGEGSCWTLTLPRA